MTRFPKGSKQQPLSENTRRKISRSLTKEGEEREKDGRYGPRTEEEKNMLVRGWEKRRKKGSETE